MKYEHYKAFLDAERKAEMSKENNAISPKHYKEILPGYEYMDMMVYMLKDMNGYEAHLMGQMYKYLMRYGKKDDKLQELGKVKWYLEFLMKRLEREETISNAEREINKHFKERG